MGQLGIQQKTLEKTVAKLCSAVKCLQNEINSDEGTDGGIATGNGGTSDYIIAHDLNANGGPTKVMVGAGSEDTAAPFWFEWDDEEITVHFLSATPAGAGNIVFNWFASY